MSTANILPMIRPSVLEDVLIKEDESIYHGKAGEYLSSHLLSTFRKCPLMYYLTVAGKYTRPDSTAYALGRATHCLVLEGEETYEYRYCSDSPINPSTGKSYGSDTKKYANWMQEIIASSCEPISKSEDELARKLAKSVYYHTEAMSLLRCASYRERVIRTSCKGIDCQSRMDAFGLEPGIVDFKTCQDLDKLVYDARRFGYIEQLAFYRMVARAAGIKVPATWMIGVEKQFPYRAGVWKIEESSLDVAEMDNQREMADLLKCQESSYWPTGYEDVRVLST